MSVEASGGVTGAEGSSVLSVPYAAVVYGTVGNGTMREWPERGTCPGLESWHQVQALTCGEIYFLSCSLAISLLG